MTNLIFIHIGKCGGTTMTHWLRKHYGPRELYALTYPDADASIKGLVANQNGVRCVAGHMPMGLADSLTEPFEYMTMVRHPVQRAQSYYHFLKRTPQNPLYSAARACSLYQFTLRDTDNQMCRHLLARDVARLPYSEWYSPPRLIGERHFQKALSALYKLFFVGVCERYQESLDALSEKMGWPKLEMARENAASGPLEELTQETVDLIEARDHWDLQLYHHANAILGKA